jgi:hypothetical protein
MIVKLLEDRSRAGSGMSGVGGTIAGATGAEGDAQ